MCVYDIMRYTLRGDYYVNDDVKIDVDFTQPKRGISKTKTEHEKYGEEMIVTVSSSLSISCLTAVLELDGSQKLAAHQNLY